LLILSLLLFAYLVSSVAAETIQADGSLIDSQPYEFPNYKGLPGWAKQLYTPQGYKKIRSGPLELLRVHYLSDGLKAVGFIYKPRLTEGKKLPVILWCRGGIGEDTAISNSNFQDLYEMYRLASGGFIVLAPQYRGVDGAEGKDEVGGADVHDILNLVPLARSLTYADADRLFIWGFSRGAMMALQAIRSGLQARAAVVVGVPVDWRSAIETNPSLARVPRDFWPEYNIRPEEAFRARSPVYWSDQINVPLLIIAGGQDPAFSPRQPLMLAEKLADQNKLFELILYANDDHPVTRHREERLQRTIDWFTNPRTFSIVNLLFETIRKNGVDAAIAQYRDLKNSKADWYAFEERELNDLGYRLLAAGKGHEAVSIFKLNAETFPNSANAYDSLGEACELTGERDLAIKSYQRSLELYRGNARANRALKQLRGN
jgi:dienelactone hydrolase